MISEIELWPKVMPHGEGAALRHQNFEELRPRIELLCSYFHWLLLSHCIETYLSSRCFVTMLNAWSGDCWLNSAELGRLAMAREGWVPALPEIPPSSDSLTMSSSCSSPKAIRFGFWMFLLEISIWFFAITTLSLRDPNSTELSSYYRLSIV